MKKFIFAVVAVMGLGVISCTHNNREKEENTQREEDEIGCLCCPVEEAPADSLDIIN